MFGLVSGLRFVLEKVSTAVDAELDDEPLLKEKLLRAQLELEEGVIGEDELREREREIFARLRELKAARGEGPLGEGRLTVDSIEADAGSDLPRRQR